LLDVLQSLQIVVHTVAKSVANEVMMMRFWRRLYRAGWGVGVFASPARPLEYHNFSQRLVV